VDHPVHPFTAKQGRVGSIDDGVHLESGNIPHPDLDPLQYSISHGLSGRTFSLHTDFMQMIAARFFPELEYFVGTYHISSDFCTGVP
jgi:hypothetical protein